MRRVVALFGKTSSGKSVCSRYVQNKYHYEIIEIGDYVRESYANSFNGTDNVVDYANWHYSQGTLPVFIMNAISYSKICEGNILFSGVRLIEEYLFLKNEYPDLIIVRIDCAEEIRKQRYYKGKDDRIPFNDRNAIEDSWIDNKWDYLKFDYVINNDGEIDSFYEQIDNVFAKIEKGQEL